MSLRPLFLCALVLAAPLGAARLTPETSAAFDRYVAIAETRMKGELPPDHFIAATPEVRAKLRDGDLRIEPRASLDQGKAVKVPDGMIQDFAGTIFILGATIAKVKTVFQDYANYKEFYKPEVTESKLIAHNGDEYDVFLRLYKKHILTAVLNTNYDVIYVMPDPHRMIVTSRSTRIAEVKNAGKPNESEEPVGNDTGFLWRLNSYWRFEEADGGVYAQCEAISLSRDVPLGLGFMLKGFLEKFPKESMVNTLRGTKSAIR